MSFRTNFQVNTHIQSNLLIFKQLHPTEISPTQMSSVSSTLLNALGTEPLIEERPRPGPLNLGDGGPLEPNEEPVSPLVYLPRSMKVDTRKNGKNTTPPCDQNFLTPTVPPHKTQNLKRWRYNSAQIVPCFGTFLMRFFCRAEKVNKGGGRKREKAGRHWEMPSERKCRGTIDCMKASRPPVYLW